MCELCEQSYSDLVAQVQAGYRDAAQRAPAGVLKDALERLAAAPDMGLGDVPDLPQIRTNGDTE